MMARSSWLESEGLCDICDHDLARNDERGVHLLHWLVGDLTGGIYRVCCGLAFQSVRQPVVSYKAICCAESPVTGV